MRRIVEERDATPAERAIDEIYTGLLAAPTALLAAWVAKLEPHNAQNEFYLTDVVALARLDGVPVEAIVAADERDTRGVNDRAQLAAVERIVQRRRADALMRDGVALADPDRFDQRGTLACGVDVTIDVGCVFEGRVTLGDGVRVGPYCTVRDATIGAGTELAAYSHVDGAEVGANARIGPYARLRPGTTLADEVHVGNFVEIKASSLGRGSKANHLAYVGDAEVGARVNIGAGAITANYDGANKHRTTSATTRRSARMPCWSRRSRSAPGPRSPAAARSPRTRPPANSPSRARGRWSCAAGSGRRRRSADPRPPDGRGSTPRRTSARPRARLLTCARHCLYI